MSETAVHSFVVRFVHEDAITTSWRGFIRHVQTHEEIHFIRIEEAIHFMARYVSVEQEEDNENKEI